MEISNFEVLVISFFEKHEFWKVEIGPILTFQKSFFFKQINYQDLEIRDLRGNSLRVNIFPAHLDVFCFCSKGRFFLSAKNVDLAHFFSCIHGSR